MSDASTQRFFDGYAGRFNAIYSSRNTLINTAVNKLFRRSMELRYLKSLDGCRPVEGKRVLDVGCGPGHYGIALAREGAARVVGIDFARGMIELARAQARAVGVGDRCEFIAGDFLAQRFGEQFDYAIVMGLMDYVAEPHPLIERVLSLTRERAFFSFPIAGGLLGWQRQVRCRRRCPLYLYSREQVVRAFGETPISIEPVARDYFVTATNS